MMAKTMRMPGGESLPRPTEELEALAEFYSTHDTSAQMEDGEWVDPRPMKTTSLRLPSDVVDALKSLAQAQGQRYTTLVRKIIEQAVSGAPVTAGQELVRSIDRRLAKIERVVAEKVAAEKPVPAARREQARKVAAAALRQPSGMVRKVAGGRALTGKFVKGRAQPKGARPHR
jgi:uncharacterized protein (DUF4415 family)